MDYLAIGFASYLSAILYAIICSVIFAFSANIIYLITNKEIPTKTIWSVAVIAATIGFVGGCYVQPIWDESVTICHKARLTTTQCFLDSKSEEQSN